MTNILKNGTALTKGVCAVLFLVFTFLYLYDYQADILAVTQHVLSKGVTHYDRTVGAVLITLVLWGIQLGVYALSRLQGFFHALTYLPSLLLLGILTDVTPNLDHESYLGNWIWLFPLLMVVYAVVVWACRQLDVIQLQDSKTSGIKQLWVSLLLMLVMCFTTCAIGSNDALFHYRMRMESLMMARRYPAAAQVGLREEKTDSSLTFLRIWNLSKSHKLGDRLFEYPLVGRSDAMLPNGTSVKLMMMPETELYRDLGVVFVQKMRPIDYLVTLHKKRYATKTAHDWLLCAYLLDADLDGFVATLPIYYKVDSLLPKHYREALTLYNHLRNQPKVTYKEAVLEADYEDFTKLRRTYSDVRQRYSAVRDSYGKTYWFYYFYPTRPKL